MATCKHCNCEIITYSDLRILTTKQKKIKNKIKELHYMLHNKVLLIYANSNASVIDLYLQHSSLDFVSDREKIQKEILNAVDEKNVLFENFKTSINYTEKDVILENLLSSGNCESCIYKTHN